MRYEDRFQEFQFQFRVYGGAHEEGERRKQDRERSEVSKDYPREKSIQNILVYIYISAPPGSLIPRYSTSQHPSPRLQIYHYHFLGYIISILLHTSILFVPSLSASFHLIIVFVIIIRRKKIATSIGFISKRGGERQKGGVGGVSHGVSTCDL